MRPTRFGLHGGIFYLVLFGGFFASPYSNLFFLLLAFLTLLGLVGLAAGRRNLRGLCASLGELEPIPSDAGAPVPLELRGDGRPRFQVEAELLLESGPGVKGLRGRIELLEERATLALQPQALARGCYVVKRAFLSSSHPFGFVHVRRSFDAPRELCVYPAPRGLAEGRSPVDTLDELMGHTDPGGGDLQPSGLRDHREGEGVRGVHWRASARRGHLVVQEWEGGRGEGIEVALDRRCESEELEAALGTISALVHVARTNKETMRLYSQDLVATFGDGHRPWAEALRFLARAETLPQDAPPPPATSPGIARLPNVAAQV